MKKILIIGGGIGGCAAGHLLSQNKDFEILLVEKSGFLGAGNRTFFWGGHPYTFGPRHFLTKQKKPNVIVETGVAAGWSSLAFLRASKNNDNVKIFSSDLPYFKEKDAEKNIGILIKNEQNKDKLKLFISGDQINLQLIIKQLQHNKIDLLHYDSDKSYSGRNLFLKSLKHYFSDDAILIFDDIHNNLHFKDFVENNNLKYTVFKNYVGLVDFSAQ